MQNDSEILLSTLLTADTVNEADFGIESISLDAIGRRHAAKHIVVNQENLAPNGSIACFYAAAFAGAADAYPLDTPELRKLAKEAYVEGWAEVQRKGLIIPNVGGRMADGVDVARHAFNAKMPSSRKVRSYRGDVPMFNAKAATESEQSFYRAVNYGWAPIIGRFSTTEIMADLLDNGTIEGDGAPSNNGKFGHLCRYAQVSRTQFPCGAAIFDNFQNREGKSFNGGTWRNVYGYDDLELKRANGQVFNSYYVFLPWA